MPGASPFSGGNYAQPPEPSVSANPYAIYNPSAPGQLAGVTTPAAFWSEDLIDKLKTKAATTGEWPIGLKLNMDSALFMIDVNDTPLMGGANTAGLGPISSRPVDQTEFFWGSQTNTVPRAHTSSAGGAGIFKLKESMAINFYVNDIVRIAAIDGTSSVLARITVKSAAVAGEVSFTAVAVSTAEGTNPLTAGVPINNLVFSMGLLAPEGSDPILVGGGLNRDFFSNYTRIYGPYSIRMTRTEQQIAKMFTTNEFNTQWARVTRNSAIAREIDLIYGVKYYDSASRMRMTGGIRYFIQALGVTVDATSLGITKPVSPAGGSNLVITNGLDPFSIGILQQKIADRGGSIDSITANPLDLAGLAMTQRDVIRTDNPLGERSRGYQQVMTIQTEFGTVTLHRNRWINRGEAYAFSRSTTTRRVMQPMVTERLPKKGDYDEVMMVCEEGVQCKGAEHMGMITKIAAPTLLGEDNWPNLPVSPPANATPDAASFVP